MSTNTVTINFPIITILTVIFVLAKLAGTIAWSWLWVLSPLWLPLAGILAFLILAFVLSIAIAIIAAIFGR